jgi:glycosyltransferase involved in cell wall biosynthesis
VHWPQKVKKVLLLSPSASHQGGVERVLQDLCSGLPACGWQPVLGLAKGARFHSPENLAPLNLKAPVVELDGRAGTSASRLRAVTQAILLQNPDVVVGARLFDAYAGVHAAKERGWRGRFVQMVRAFEPDYLSDLRRWGGLVDAVAADGKLIAAACIEICRVEARRVASLPGGIVPSSGFLRPEVDSTWHLIYAGRVDEGQKRCGDFVPFAHALIEAGVNATLHFAGGGPFLNSLAARLEQECPQLPVHNHGWLDSFKLRDLLRQMHIFVHFAAWEGVTIAPREAMVEGVVPVVSEFLGLWSEGLFQPGSNSLAFPVGQPRVAAELVCGLVQNPQIWSELSTRASRSQGAEYLLPENIRLWADLLERTLSLPELPPMEVPSFPSDSGRLDHWPLPDVCKNWIRRQGVRHHRDAGSEWPHASPWLDPADAGSILQWAKNKEALAKARALAIKTDTEGNFPCFPNAPDSSWPITPADKN